MTSTLEGDANALKALGHGALSLVNAAIVLAIVAAILAGQTASIIQGFFGFLSWLVGQIIAPLQQQQPIAFTNTLLPTWAVPGGSGGGSSTPSSSATTQNPSITPTGGANSTESLPSGWSNTYFPGSTYGFATLSDGSSVAGYHLPGQ